MVGKAIDNISLDTDYTIRISVENWSRTYVYESIDGFLIVVEVLCIIDSIVVVCIFLRFWIPAQSEKVLGQKEVRFSGLMHNDYVQIKPLLVPLLSLLSSSPKSK